MVAVAPERTGDGVPFSVRCASDSRSQCSNNQCWGMKPTASWPSVLFVFDHLRPRLRSEIHCVQESLRPVTGDDQTVISLPEDRVDFGSDLSERPRDLVVARPLCVILF